MADEFRLNGHALSWGDLVFKIGNEKYRGFTAVSYDEKIERSLVYGMGKDHAPQGKTAGKYVPGAVKVKGRKSSVIRVRQALAALSPNGRSYGVPVFEASLQGISAGSNQAEIDTQFRRCQYAERSVSYEENADPLMEELIIVTEAIVENGLTLFDSSEELD